MVLYSLEGREGFADVSGLRAERETTHLDGLLSCIMSIFVRRFVCLIDTLCDVCRSHLAHKISYDDAMCVHLLSLLLQGAFMGASIVLLRNFPTFTRVLRARLHTGKKSCAADKLC